MTVKKKGATKAKKAKKAAKAKSVTKSAARVQDVNKTPAVVKTPKRRDDPHRKRDLALRLEIGSEHEVGHRLLDVLRKEGDKFPIVNTEEAFWEYVKSTGLWTEITPGELHRIIGSFDGATFPSGKQVKPLKISQAFAEGAIERAAYLAEAKEFFSSVDPVLAFTNCVVRLTPDGKIEQLDHAPEHHVRVGYPFAYDPEAKCERFEKMLAEHFEGDVDAREKILCEQEFFGACLFGIATTYQKCLALPSDGGSGRSTLLQTIEAAFPKGTVSHIDVKDLRSAERRTRLVGRRLNFSDEVPPDAFIESEDFKKVVTGDIITAEGKYRASFEYRPIAGHVFPIQLIASAELTTAFFRRFIIIRYNRTFEGDPNRDLNLAQKIIASELPGLVRYLIDGCARLRAQGAYTIPASHQKETAQWRMDSDTVMSFVAATCVKSLFEEPKDRHEDTKRTLDRHDWTYSSALYESYEKWCDVNGHRKPVASNRFGERLKKLGIGWHRTEKGMLYGILERSRAETRETLRAKEENRKPRPIFGYFDQPDLALVTSNDSVQIPPAKNVPVGPPRKLTVVKGEIVE